MLELEASTKLKVDILPKVAKEKKLRNHNQKSKVVFRNVGFIRKSSRKHLVNRPKMGNSCF